MLDDVAVPDVEARKIEQGFDPGDLARIGDDGVLEACLPAFRRAAIIAFKWLALHHLELHLMNVNGVGVLGPGGHSWSEAATRLTFHAPK